MFVVFCNFRVCQQRSTGSSSLLADEIVQFCDHFDYSSSMNLFKASADVDRLKSTIATE